ncbi:hypothetical protein [Allocoleopsis franciscana]|uniref:Uncharacterized protein n=1 Tax=Allocoleopsis franciscana PCC 7113 TaxID=1173027 RepID=K9WEG2_9CYAN|nr:hypothetical protein [Allocoleopsis franciscana]AFZ18583.1 hypothetical protein Mic7113_2800 [Allocoleopsis franciscana PCC 7113]
MLTATEDSIRSLSEKNSENIINSLDSAKILLEQLYESGEGQFSREEILDDLMKLVEISERIKSTGNLGEKIEIFFGEYQTLSNQLKTKYNDFLPSRVVKKLETEEKYMEGFKRLLIAQEYMLQAFDDKYLVDQAGKLYTGMVKLSEVLEQYIFFSPDWLIEIVKKIPLAILSDPTLQPEQPGISQEVVNYLTALKNTSRGVLWQIYNYKKEKKHTVGELLNWLEIAPSWAGNDFEECLEYVNRTRK